MPPAPQQTRTRRSGLWQTKVQDQEGGSYNKDGIFGMLLIELLLRKMEQHLSKSDRIKIGIGELESLLGPDGLRVNLRQIPRYARRKGCRIFEICSSKEHRVSTWLPPKCDGMSARG